VTSGRLEVPPHQFQGSYWFNFFFIHEEEEKALGILEHNTVDWRRQNNIPDSDYDGFGQEKYLTQFQQLILVMTKKGTEISEEILLQESV
jgi:hypothetical protein